MRIWPILLDPQLSYLGRRGRNASLLLLPLGAQTLIEHLLKQLAPLTTRRLMVMTQGVADPGYGGWIRAVCPTANVLTTAADIADVVASFEMSDALLILDPRHLLLRASELSSLEQHFAGDPRVAHYLVAFESGVGGTQERVSFDAAGDVRKILRHYQPATWPFIAGVPAALVPVASGVLADGVTPASLAELRHMLTARGVPSRDVPVSRGTFNLTHESGLLAATEHFVRQVTSAARPTQPPAAALYVGSGQSIHPSARISGPVVIHAAVRIDENAMVLGPAVIGARAHISAGSVVVQAVVGADCIVPGGSVVRNRVWFEELGDSPGAAYQPQSYPDRLARLITDARSHEDGAPAGPRTRHSPHDPFKRALDITVAALALIALAPLLLLVTAAVWLESKGSAFYGDEREGLGGRVFRCWKFRTMRTGAHAAQLDLQLLDKMDGPHFKLDRDPRVTRVGRCLRALNLDELPQLFNVLIGEMSLVGPRPSPFRENQVCVPWREARLSVRPGITGFWQVCRHDRSDGDFHQWIEFDLLYVQHMSFWLDLRILLATLLTLGGKATHIPSTWLVSPVDVEQSRKWTAAWFQPAAATPRRSRPARNRGNRLPAGHRVQAGDNVVQRP